MADGRIVDGAVVLRGRIALRRERDVDECVMSSDVAVLLVVPDVELVDEVGLRHLVGTDGSAHEPDELPQLIVCNRQSELRQHIFEAVVVDLARLGVVEQDSANVFKVLGLHLVVNSGHDDVVCLKVALEDIVEVQKQFKVDFIDPWVGKDTSHVLDVSIGELNAVLRGVWPVKSIASLHHDPGELELIQHIVPVVVVDTAKMEGGSTHSACLLLLDTLLELQSQDVDIDSLEEQSLVDELDVHQVMLKLLLVDVLALNEALQLLQGGLVRSIHVVTEADQSLEIDQVHLIVLALNVQKVG